MRDQLKHIICTWDAGMQAWVLGYHVPGSEPSVIAFLFADGQLSVDEDERGELDRKMGPLKIELEIGS